LAVVALLIGLPLGVVVGWRAWAVFADALGVSTSAGTPLLAVLVAIPITLVLFNAAAAGPGWAASRVKPAAVLRSE
jgi:ABC-type antimicrobial peptide transport system permease subunit